ncbi:MAG TPA: PEP-CTERM sorting domain-containing protein [Tepidisphaeraceae bacterium]|jgi:hypothetical protein
MRIAASIAASASAVFVLSAATAVRGAITGPYTVDGNTLHLWHMDDAAASTSAADAVGGGLNVNVIDQVTANPTTGANAILGPAGFGGFGTAVNMAGNATIPTNAPTVIPHRPILLGAAALSNADGDTVPFSFSSAPGAGAPGAFTMEALIKFDSSFDPAATNYRNATAATGGNYPMEIISGEGDGNGARNFQFRFDQIGGGTGANATGQSGGTAAPRIEFANLFGISGNQSIACNIPTSGPNAINNTDWFHIAVSYNGLENTAGNLSFYWTKVDPSATTANLIGVAQMTKDMLSAATDFAIGDEARDAGSGVGEGESFVGLIDEVRISGVGRGAGDFIFVPEPASIGLLAGLAALGMLQRRK